MRNFNNATAISNANVNLTDSVNVAGIIDMRSGNVPMRHDSDHATFDARYRLHLACQSLNGCKHQHKRFYATSAMEAYSAPATGITPATPGSQPSLLSTRSLAGTGRVKLRHRANERTAPRQLHAEPRNLKQTGWRPFRVVSSRTAPQG